MTEQAKAQTISIHAPRMGSDLLAKVRENWPIISIHAPRMGSDRDKAQTWHQCGISIHAPRMGSDQGLSGATEEQMYFNPRSPHGERQRLIGF